MSVDFVEGWSIIQTLGEGAYGEVKLLLNKQNGDLVAMKVVNLERHPEAKDLVRKEVIIHKMLKDPHVVTFLGHRSHQTLSYVFLEYAPHGELFDRIEPDVGMDINEAQKYMYQLVSGVEYLHSMGVAHRDLKPENLLLDAKDNLKISDFGLATIFRVKGKERLLDKKCGTLPYVAPEVLLRPYLAEPADVWSCGIILVAMLGGELPWDKAEEKCKEYRLWKSGDYTCLSPWTKMSTLALSLVRRLLAPLPSHRAKLSFVKQHRWIQPHLANDNTQPDCGKKPKKRLCRMDSESNRSRNRRQLVEGLVHSQPTGSCSSTVDKTSVVNNNGETTAGEREDGKGATPLEPPPQHFAFSQPVGICDMLLPSQGLPLTQNLTQQTQLNPVQKLVKRMTRFFVSLSLDQSVSELTTVLDKYSMDWKINTPYCVTVETIDKRKTQLVFKATLMEMEVGSTLLDFRLSKGCGLEFKKHFLSIKAALSDILVSPPSWAAALHLT